MEVVVTTGGIRRASSHNATVNKPTPSFYRLDAPRVAQPCQSTEGKLSGNSYNVSMLAYLLSGLLAARKTREDISN